MASASTIDRLPVELKEQLQAWLRDTTITQAEATRLINEQLKAHGHDDEVSKSAVNRYSMRMEQVGKRLRQSREVSEMWIAKLGAAPQGKTGQLINEMLRVISFEMTDKLLDEIDSGDPDKMPGIIDMLKDLSLTTQRLEQAANLNHKRDTEIREQAKQEAADVADAALKEQGATKETRQSIMDEIMGIKSDR